MLRVLVVDDEPLARRRLDILLRDIEGVEPAGAAPDGAAALRMIGELAPDVVLLDIKMPGLSGLDLLDRLRGGDKAPVVIFVTAFDRFAVDAFERAACDYLLKPVEPARLAEALRRARAALEARAAGERLAELKEIIANLREGPPDPAFDREVWVQDRGDRLAVPVAEIDWIAAERDYVRIHAAGRSWLVRGSIGAMAARLDPKAFARVHRSSLVRLDRVVRVRRTVGGAALVLSCGAEVAVSRRHLSEIRALGAGRASPG